MKRIKTLDLLVIIIFLIATVIAPAIFVNFNIGEWADFSDKGDIGDTIGGITAPFIGVLSAYLLWRTLYEQICFSKKQEEDNAINQIIAITNGVIEIEGRLNYDTEKDTNENVKHITCVNSLTALIKSNEKYTFFYSSFVVLYRELILIVAKCHQILALCKQLDRDDKHLYMDFAMSYISIIHDFLCSINSKSISADGLDTIKIQDDPECDKSEKDLLLERVKDSCKSMEVIISKYTIP